MCVCVRVCVLDAEAFDPTSFDRVNEKHAMNHTQDQTNECLLSQLPWV